MPSTISFEHHRPNVLILCCLSFVNLLVMFGGLSNDYDRFTMIEDLDRLPERFRSRT
jgi:hypothetical protein